MRRERNQAQEQLQRVKEEAAILKDENELFITEYTGNNNTANGRSTPLAKLAEINSF